MWTAITEDDVRASINSAEDTAFRTHLLVAGQSDPLLKIITQVTLEFREAIRSCSENSLTADTTLLPQTSHHHAVAVIRYRLLTRINHSISEDRRTEYRTAQKYLEDVCSCKRKILSPNASPTAGAENYKPSIKGRTKVYGRQSQDGI